MNAQLIVEDAGVGRFQAYLQALKAQKVSVGYQSPEGTQRYESGISVAKLAAVHEFGGDDLAARPFIRPTIQTHSAAIAQLALREIEMRLERVVEGHLDPEQAATEVGSAVGSFVVKKIRARLESASSWAAKLDPETVERKGSATPLQETGLLIQALSWRVSKGSQTLARGNE